MSAKVYERTVKITREEIPESLIEKLKVFHGLPPHDGWSNICARDGYFYQSIQRDFGSDMIAAAEELVIKPMQQELAEARRAIINKYRRG